MTDTDWRGWRRWRADTITIALVHLAIGANLILDDRRFANTPSYGNLLQIMSAPWWGTIFVTVGVILGVALFVRLPRPLIVAGHTAAIAVTAVWLAAFIVRYFTDSSTTVVNVVSWSVFLSLLIRAMLGLDDARQARGDE